MDDLTARPELEFAGQSHPLTVLHVQGSLQIIDPVPHQASLGLRVWDGLYG